MMLLFFKLRKNTFVNLMTKNLKLILYYLLKLILYLFIRKNLKLSFKINPFRRLSIVNFNILDSLPLTFSECNKLFRYLKFVFGNHLTNYNHKSLKRHGSISSTLYASVVSIDHIMFLDEVTTQRLNK